jgi:hypothetical protein
MDTAFSRDGVRAVIAWYHPFKEISHQVIRYPLLAGRGGPKQNAEPRAGVPLPAAALASASDCPRADSAYCAGHRSGSAASESARRPAGRSDISTPGPGDHRDRDSLAGCQPPSHWHWQATSGPGRGGPSLSRTRTVKYRSHGGGADSPGSRPSLSRSLIIRVVTHHPSCSFVTVVGN